jgi:hypothetical protein
LKLSDGQKQELQKQRPSYLKASDAGEKLWAFLKETLNPEQFPRFRQLELQHEGPPAYFRPGIANELQIRDEPRNQFMAFTQEMQKKKGLLMKEAMGDTRMSTETFVCAIPICPAPAGSPPFQLPLCIPLRVDSFSIRLAALWRFADNGEKWLTAGLRTIRESRRPAALSMNLFPPHPCGRVSNEKFHNPASVLCQAYNAARGRYTESGIPCKAHVCCPLLH